MADPLRRALRRRLLLAVVYNVHVRHAGRGWRDHHSLGVDPEAVLTAMGTGAKLTKWQRTLFLGMLDDASRLFRAHQGGSGGHATVEPVQYDPIATINIGPKIPLGTPSVVYPILVASRARLEDGFTVTANGRPVSTLNHVEAAAHVGRVLRSLLEQAGGTALDTYMSVKTSGGKTLEHRAIEYLGCVGRLGLARPGNASPEIRAVRPVLRRNNGARLQEEQRRIRL